jgi:hypothetical protein
METEESRIGDDADDPWVFFGGYGKVEVNEAASLLRAADIVFEVRECSPEVMKGWWGPFALWIHEEHTVQASSLLQSHFKPSDKKPPIS